jgi:hypothetical protein
MYVVFDLVAQTFVFGKYNPLAVNSAAEYFVRIGVYTLVFCLSTRMLL